MLSKNLIVAFIVGLLVCLPASAAPLSNVTLSIKSSLSTSVSEANCVVFTFSPSSSAANTILISPSPLERPGYVCNNCVFVLVTAANSTATATLDAQFTFVNATLPTHPVSGTPALLLQLTAATFPPFPALSSCTLCLSPYTPSLPPGSHPITFSTHIADLLPANISACPNSTAPCPLSFQHFNATAPLDSSPSAVTLHINPPALFSPSSIPAATSRTVVATVPRFSLPSNASFTAVSSGADFGCGLTTSEAQCSAGSSNVYCWGSYNLNSKWYPTQIPLPPAASGVSVCAGWDHACVVTDGGLVYCWGRNIEHQCGSNASAYVPASNPLLVPGIVDAKVVKCGKVSTCASTGTGTQHQLVCWGNKLAVQNMLKTNMTWLTPTVIPLPNNKPLKEGTHTFSIGTYTGCALVAESSSTSVLWCWGDIRFTVPEQSLSPVPFSTSVMPIPQTAGSDIVAVAVGANHACAVDDVVGGLYCWGGNIFCQLGYESSCSGSTDNPKQANPVRSQEQLGQKVAAVTVGNSYTCAITIGKALFCWGDNRFGFLGNISVRLAVIPTPVLVNLNASALSVSAASFTSGPVTCAVADTVPKRMYCWGYSLFGGVGIGPVQQSQSRVREPALVAQVVAVGSVAARTVANLSMWRQGLGAIQSKSKVLQGSDVLVVVMNASTAELDLQSSAFETVSGSVDVTFSINCAAVTGVLAITPYIPCSQRLSCTSCAPNVGSGDCKWCTADYYNPVNGFCAASCPARLYTLTSIESCAGSSEPIRPPPFNPPPPEIDCAGRACGWPSSVQNATSASVAAIILCLIASFIQPYVAVLLEARLVISKKREAAAAAQERAAELDQHADANASRVPTYSELMCPASMGCQRKALRSSPDSVSIEMLARTSQQHPSAASMIQLPPAVHASGYVDADFDGPWGGASPLQRLKTVWPRLIPAYLVVVGVYFATAFLFFKYVVYDNAGNVKPLKGACFSVAEMQENLCVFAAGQGAYGLIAFGQAAVGLIVIAQGSVGIIVAIGQGSLSLGYSVGQVASGCFIEVCQVGVSLVAIKRCMLGLRAFAWISAPMHLVESTFIATCICNSVPRERRVVDDQEITDAAIAAFAAAVAAANRQREERQGDAAPAVAEAMPEDGNPNSSPSRSGYARAPRRAAQRPSGLSASMEQV